MRTAALFSRSTHVPARNWIVTAFFAAVFLLGLAVFRDYGVSWDEPADHYNGVVNTNYIAQYLDIPVLAEGLQNYPNIPQLDSYPERDHGPAFEYPVVMLSELVGAQNDPRMLYHLRHFMVFFVWFGGLLAFYGLAKRRFQDWRLALLGAACLLATPRFFAEGFYNAKDAVFLALFIVGIYTLVELLHRPTWRRGLWHGVACGAAIALRVNGILLLPLTVAGLILTAFTASSTQRRQLVVGTLFWIPFTIAATILLWPWLWEAPWQNITSAFESLSNFKRWDGEVLYNGSIIRAAELPWHYAFVWIGLTTPLAYLAAFGLGVLMFITRLLLRLPHAWRTEAGRLDLVFAAWLAGPLLAVVVLHSVLYDGWRHLYFVYPPILLFGLGAVQHLLRWTVQAQNRAKRIVATTTLLVLALGALEPVWRIIRDHPHQQVYFNNLISAADAERGFERDYWALSYRQGLEWVLQNDSSPRIKVAAFRNDVMANGALILSPEQQARIEIVPQEEATYFLALYRTHPLPYEGFGWEVHAEYSNGVKLLSVYKE